MLPIKSTSLLKMLKSKIFPFVCTQMGLLQSVSLSNCFISSSISFAARLSLIRYPNF